MTGYCYNCHKFASINYAACPDHPRRVVYLCSVVCKHIILARSMKMNRADPSSAGVSR